MEATSVSVLGRVRPFMCVPVAREYELAFVSTGHDGRLYEQPVAMTMRQLQQLWQMASQD